jgi:hypothetical protein
MTEKFMDYIFLEDLHKEFAPPENGILSRILHKDERVNITVCHYTHTVAEFANSSTSHPINSVPSMFARSCQEFRTVAR